MSRVVFVGNVPYDVEEDKLVPIFSTVGPIAGFRLMIDKESGKSKGYAFCEYHDHDTAASAVRNLNGTEVNGRPLRIDLADSDPFFEGKSTQSGRTKRDDDDRRREKFDPLASLPPGVAIPVGSSALDVITKSLANIPPAQMLDILGQMKQYIVNSPEHARGLLNTHPQLAYALFQAMLLNNMIDPTTLQRMIALFEPRRCSFRSPHRAAVPSPSSCPAYTSPNRSSLATVLWCRWSSFCPSSSYCTSMSCRLPTSAWRLLRSRRTNSTECVRQHPRGPKGNVAPDPRLDARTDQRSASHRTSNSSAAEGPIYGNDVVFRSSKLGTIRMLTSKSSRARCIPVDSEYIHI